jgi:PKD repeat protein
LQDSGVITWNFGDGDSSNSFNPVHVYKTAGKKIIMVQVKSFYNSCISYKTDSILVSPIPQINLTVDTNEACAYKVFNFSVNSPQTNIFNWDFGDSNIATGTFVKHLYQNGGTFNVRIVAQTTANCFDTTFKQIVVFPVPIADFSFTPKDTCTGPVNVKFTNLSIGAFNYLWDFGNGNISTNINPTFTYTNVGVYPIKLISSNQFSCFDTSENKYVVYQAPKAALDFSPDKGCPPFEVTFENKSSFGTNYFWNFGDGDTSTIFSPKHTYVKSGIYKVQLIAIAGGHCFDTLVSEKSVTVFAKPTPAFTHLLQTDKKPYRTVSFNASIDSVSQYEWYYKGNIIGRGKSPTFRFDIADSGILEIVLKIVSIDGCDSSVTQTIELPPYWNGLYVPNAFTPTLGEGGANEFKPIGIELKNYRVRVFNKWGELMWESAELTEKGEPKFGWDGNDRNGMPCSQGSYVWVIEAEFTDGKAWRGMKLNDGNLHTKGNVTLIR